jgi:hypothetical protein
MTKRIVDLQQGGTIVGNETVPVWVPNAGTTQKFPIAQPNGLASLDTSGKLAQSQIPSNLAALIVAALSDMSSVDPTCFLVVVSGGEMQLLPLSLVASGVGGGAAEDDTTFILLGIPNS